MRWWGCGLIWTGCRLPGGTALRRQRERARVPHLRPDLAAAAGRRQHRQLHPWPSVAAVHGVPRDPPAGQHRHDGDWLRAGVVPLDVQGCAARLLDARVRAREDVMTTALGAIAALAFLIAVCVMCVLGLE